MRRTGVRVRRLALRRLALLVVLPGVLVGAAAQAAGGSSSPQPAAPGQGSHRPAAHVVRPGETLWEIARGIVGPEADPRPAVAEIRDANGLGAGPLLPGTRLVLP